MDNFKKYTYWLELCDDDLSVSKTLLNSKHLLHCGYFCQLVAEKAFKAIISKNTDEIPPKIHDLPKLAKIGGIYNALGDYQLNLLDKLKNLQIEARYPEYKEQIMQALDFKYCETLVRETEELLCWIKQQLGK